MNYLKKQKHEFIIMTSLIVAFAASVMKIQVLMAVSLLVAYLVFTSEMSTDIFKIFKNKNFTSEKIAFIFFGFEIFFLLSIVIFNLNTLLDIKFSNRFLLNMQMNITMFVVILLVLSFTLHMVAYIYSSLKDILTE